MNILYNILSDILSLVTGTILSLLILSLTILGLAMGVGGTILLYMQFFK